MPFVLKNYSAITENSTKIRPHDIIEHFLKNIRNLKKKLFIEYVMTDYQFFLKNLFYGSIMTIIIKKTDKK